MNGANLPMSFDPSEYQPVMGGGNALPVSDKKGHLVVITDSDFKDNSKGTGKMLALTLHIQDGPHAGSEGDWNLNLGHPNATTVRIALNELSCICHAVGHTGALNNAGALHNKPFRVVVTAQTGEGGEKGYTNVTKVLRADGSKLTDPPGSAGAPPAGPPAPAPPAAPPAAQPSFPVTMGVQPQAPPQPQQPPQGWPAQPQQAPPQQQPPQQWPPQPQAAPPAPPQPQPGAVPPWGAPPQ